MILKKPSMAADSGFRPEVPSGSGFHLQLSELPSGLKTRLPRERTTRVCNQLEECLNHLKSRGLQQQVQLIASYPSYMTGLMFHKYEEKPEEYCVYSCVPEPSNPHDPNAFGVLSSRNKRIAFVPKVMSAHLVSAHPGILQGSAVVVAFCTGGCTEKSAQCIYNVYHVMAPPMMQPMSAAPQQQIVPSQPSGGVGGILCTVCRGPANRWISPCRHYACCVGCSYRLINLSCPACHTQVTGIISV